MSGLCSRRQFDSAGSRSPVIWGRVAAQVSVPAAPACVVSALVGDGHAHAFHCIGKHCMSSLCSACHFVAFAFGEGGPKLIGAGLSDTA